MVDIVANPEWKSVRILERDEVALGGYGGNMNEQATALVARTELLMQEKADTTDIVQGQYSFSTLAEFDSKKATIPANSVVIINEVGANQGTNTWNGTTLTKSAYDPLMQAKSYTDTAKSEAIAAASSDATTKANAAKNEAIVAASTDATTKANAAEANAKSYAENVAVIQSLSGTDIYYRAKENPSKTFQAIWQEYKKPVYHLGNNVIVDTTGAVLKTIEEEIVFTVKLTSANETFIYPTRATGTQVIDVSIDWGDGTTSNHTNYSISHAYTGAIGDEFQIKLKGVMPEFDFSVGNGSRRTSRLMLKSIDRNTMPSMTYFNIDGCTNITYIGQAAFSSFSGTTLKISNIANWSNVTLHKNAFLGLSQVTNIDNLFGNNVDLAIPSGLFDPFVNVTSAGSLLYGYKKTTLPAGIFDKMVNLENVSSMFYSSLLTSIDNRIFKNQTKLKNVSQCFRLSSTLVADALQLYTDMNQGLPTTTNLCFAGTNAMTNLASVPTGWKV